MDSGGPSILSSGVWLIPIILLAILGGLYLLAYTWQKQTQAGVKTLRSDLRRLGTRLRQIIHTLRDYSPEESEPYRSRLSALQSHLEDLNKDLLALEQHHVGVQERIHYLAANRWQAILGGPYFWYLLRQDVKEMQKGRDTVQAALEAAEERANTIAKIAWEVAEGCREVNSTYEEAARLLESLRSKGVHGGSIDAARQQEQKSRAALSNIPGYYLTGSEEDVLAQGGRESVAQAYAIVEEQRPLLDELLAWLQQQQKKYGEATEKITQMRQSISLVDAAASNPPQGLLISNLKKNLEGLQVISNNLHATQSRLELESIPQVIQEATRVDEAARELDAQLKKARQELGELSKLLPELNEGLRQLSAQFAALGTSAAHPISWDKSRHLLTDLSRQASGMGGATRPRTPEGLTQDLETVQRLLERQRELSRHCQEIAQQHAELINLLESPEFRQGETLVTEARKLAARVGEYDPENWPRSLAAPTLAEDINRLAQTSRDLIWGERSQSIPEDQIGERLEATRRLSQAWQDTQKRMEGIGTRLEEIQQAEQYAHDQIEANVIALNQIATLARSNPFLEQIAGQEITRLQNSLGEQREELELRSTAPIEKKTRQVGGLVTRIESAVNGWLDRFNKEIDGLKKAISEKLAQADPFKNLDEPAIAEGRRLLAAAQSFSGGGLLQKSRMNLEEAILELKRRSDFWQQGQSNLRALEDVLNPLLETYDITSQHREAARSQMAEIENWMRASRNWPPTSLNLNAEKEEFSRLEGQWEALRSQEARAIHLVANLGGLANKYASLREKVHTTAERVAEEKNRVENLEGELEEMIQAWQNHSQTYQANPGTGDEIRRFLAEAQRERESIKRDYKGGTKDYTQSMSALQALHRRIRVTQIALDETHVIDVNGRVIQFR